LEFSNNLPIYLQIVEHIKMMIISGKIAPGERLPSVRDIAAEAKVNPNTVMKALADLEDIKLIYTERTNGKYVTQDAALIEKEKRAYAEKLTEEYLNGMNKLGFEVSDVKAFIE